MTEPVRIGDATLYLGDVLAVLATLSDESVHCVVTSPPYWGLRDYGVPGQIGLEAMPEEYVTKMVDVFREVRRVLRGDGTLWLNLGDSYNAYNGGAGPSSALSQTASEQRPQLETGYGLRTKGLKPKDMVGIPWRVAFALQADGWYLRSDIIWAKPNPMPESVTDRPTKAHEYVFLLSKSARYYYDAEAIKEPIQSGPSDIRKMIEGLDRIGGKHKVLVDPLSAASSTTHIGQKRSVGDPSGRNRRTVWTIATEPYPEAHFATFPRKLVQPCILAGCPEGGTVLDPFGGSGTTAEVALEYGRRAILIELKPEYVELQKRRLASVAGRPLINFAESKREAVQMELESV